MSHDKDHDHRVPKPAPTPATHKRPPDEKRHENPTPGPREPKDPKQHPR